METVTFKTDNGNYYLYSPLHGVIMPIKQEIVHHIDKGNSSIDNTMFYQTIKSCGLINETIDSFDAYLCSNDINKTLATLPQIVFEVTSSCNLSCVYCCYKEAYDTFKDRSHGKLNPQYAKLILDHLSDRFSKWAPSNSPFVISFYGGEPLLAIDVIKQIVEYAKNKDFGGRKVVYSMTTNGILLNRYIDFLVDNNFQLLVSLDGDKNGNSYRVDKNGAQIFDKVFNNLLYVKDKYPSFFKTIRYNSVFTNISSTKNIIDFFRKNLGRTPSISPLLEPNDTSEEARIIRKMIKDVDIPYDIENDYEMFVEIPIHKTISSILINLIRNTYFNENAYNKQNAKKYITGTCIPFSKRMFITNDGKITLCEKIPRTYSYGIIDLKKGAVIFNEQSIVNKFNMDISGVKEVCESCYMHKLCNQCIYTFRDKKCSLYKNKDDFSKFMSKIFTYIENHPSVITNIRNNVLIK